MGNAGLLPSAVDKLRAQRFLEGFTRSVLTGGKCPNKSEQALGPVGRSDVGTTRRASFCWDSDHLVSDTPMS